MPCIFVALRTLCLILLGKCLVWVLAVFLFQWSLTVVPCYIICLQHGIHTGVFAQVCSCKGVACLSGCTLTVITAGVLWALQTAWLGDVNMSRRCWLQPQDGAWWVTDQNVASQNGHAITMWLCWIVYNLRCALGSFEDCPVAIPTQVLNWGSRTCYGHWNDIFCSFVCSGIYVRCPH